MSPCWLILLFLGQDHMPTPVLGSLLLASLSCSYLPHSEPRPGQCQAVAPAPGGA